MMIEKEVGNTNALATQTNEMEDNNERDKLVQFETPDESSANAQKYFSNVSANLRQ